MSTDITPAPQRDLWKERTAKSKRLADGRVYLDELVVHKITVLSKRDEEALTFIPEDDESYAHVRWVSRTGWFMASWVAHQFKRIKGVRLRDFHISCYLGTGKNLDEKRGAIDIEFGEDVRKRVPMMSIQDLNMRLVGEAGIALQDTATGKRFWIEVTNGALKIRPVAKGELHDDTEKT